MMTRFANLAARWVLAIGVVATLALTTAAAIAQPHTDPHHPPPSDPTTGSFAHEPPDPKGLDKVHPDDHGSEHHGLAAINWTDLSDKSRPAFIALLINFGLLAAIYYSLGKKPITEGLKQRRINIGKDIDEARKMLDEAKQRAKKYQSGLKNADADAAAAKTALVTAAKGEVDRVLAETQERTERMKRDAERLVEQEQKQLQHDLLIETIELAVVQAHQLLEHSTTHEDHARLANELLAELGRKPTVPRVASASILPPRSGGVT